jgi:hypothetical protein
MGHEVVEGIHSHLCPWYVRHIQCTSTMVTAPSIPETTVHFKYEDVVTISRLGKLEWNVARKIAKRYVVLARLSVIAEVDKARPLRATFGGYALPTFQPCRLPGLVVLLGGPVAPCHMSGGDELDRLVKTTEFRQMMTKACPSVGPKEVIRYEKFRIGD